MRLYVRSCSIIIMIQQDRIKYLKVEINEAEEAKHV